MIEIIESMSLAKDFIFDVMILFLFLTFDFRLIIIINNSKCYDLIMSLSDNINYCVHIW